MTILIATDQITNQNLILTLQAAADDGIRIYLLLGSQSSNKTAIDALSGRCLIRTGVPQQGALVLADHSTNKARGMLLTNNRLFSFENQKSWVIELEQQQIEDSFRSFCKLYWEDSGHEYLRQSRPKEICKHPSGEIITNHSYQLQGALNDCLKTTLESLLGATDSAFDIHGCHLLLNSGSSHLIARQGVALTDTPVPNMLISDEDSWLLPDSTDSNTANWALRLSDQQSEVLVTAFERSIKNATWQYQSATKLGELDTDHSIRFGDQPELVRQVKAHREKVIEPVYTRTIDSFLNDSSDALVATTQTSMQRDFLAREIEYEVTIHPPYCPKDARPDELYESWKSTDRNWQERLSYLDEQNQLIDRKQEGIGSQLKDYLKGFLLGDRQSVKTINHELAELRCWSAKTATPSERLEYRKRLENLENRVQDRNKRTETEVDKAEQERLWKEKRSQLERDRDSAQSALDQSERDFQSLDSTTEERLKGAEKIFQQQWRDAIGTLSEDQLQKITPSVGRLPIENAPVEKDAGNSANTTRSVLLNMNFKTALGLRREMKEKIFRKHYKALNSALENHQLAQQKIERDQTIAEESLANARRKLEDAKRALESHGDIFTYTPERHMDSLDKQLGLKAPDHRYTQFEWPKEELPAEGSELKTHKKQRWLVIHDTNQLDQARKDAERLNAIICVNHPI